MTPRQRRLALATSALTLGALSALLPVLALPALFATTLAALILDGRARLVGGLLGGIFATAGFVRFVTGWVAPNIVAAGQRSAEEVAVSRLREIQWAEARALELGLATDAGGHVRAATLDELVTTPAPGGAPLLRPDLYLPRATNVRSVQGYDFELHPAPSLESRRRWVAYAWPAAGAGGGKRVFYIDSDDRICETTNADARYGPGRAPAVFAALGTPSFDATACGQGTDGNMWLPWKGKTSRVDSR